MPKQKEFSTCLLYIDSDKDFAEALSSTLRVFGIKVWRAERDSRVGVTMFLDQERNVAQADYIVVLWSKNSVNSSTLRRITEEARERKALRPVLIDNVQLPEESAGVKAADLTKWDGINSDYPEIEALRQSLVSKKVPISLPTFRVEHWLTLCGLILTAILGIAGNQWIRCKIGVEQDSSCSSKPPFTPSPTTESTFTPSPSASSQPKITPSPDPDLSSKGVDLDNVVPPKPSPSASSTPITKRTTTNIVDVSSIDADNIANYAGVDGNGTNIWNWAVFVQGSDQALEQIQCVRYNLHSTFIPNVIDICEIGSRRYPFALSRSGWGTFEIQIQIFFKDGSQRSLTHELRF